MSEYRLTWSHGSATVLSTAAMLADCTFQLDKGPFSPFARAPWMGTVTDPRIIGHLRELGGDFVGIPFGSGGRADQVPSDWAALMIEPALKPIHGPAADADWTIVTADDAAVTLRLDYPATSPVSHLVRTIAGRPDAPALDLSGTPRAPDAAYDALAKRASDDWQARLGQVGLRLAHFGLGAVQLGLVRFRIDLEQRLALLDFTAFFKQALEHDTVDAGAHLRDADGFGTGRQFGFQRDFLDFGRDDAHFRLGHLGAGARSRCLFLVAAGGQKGDDGNAGGSDFREGR